jgi:hypothetical protein
MIPLSLLGDYLLVQEDRLMSYQMGMKKTVPHVG